MLKFFGAVIIAIFYSAFTTDGKQWTLTGVLVGIGVCYALPFIFKKLESSASDKRWKEQAEIDRMNRESEEERRHREELRRERERLEMHSEVRVRELITTLEAQHRMDAEKMARLTKIKAEFANRQQTDMASLLSQLESMRAGGR